jgi:hypothetical protein
MDPVPGSCDLTGYYALREILLQHHFCCSVWGALSAGVANSARLLSWSADGSNSLRNRAH